MPIKSLEYTSEALPLDHLKNTVLGIDVNHYILSILLPHVDPTFEAIGGFPISLREKLLSDAAVLESYGITPVYVFPGLNSSIQFSYIEQKDLLPYEKHLKQLWESKAKNKDADISFRELDNPFLLRILLDELLLILQDNELEYLISPFVQHNQLVYMLETNIVNCIYISNDALLFSNLQNFIVNIDFKSKYFNYLDNKQFLSNLNLNFKQFRDISMCVGNVFQPFQLISGTSSSFKSLLQSTHNGTFNAYSTLSSNSTAATGNSGDSRRLKKFTNGCTFLEFCPVLKSNGRVEPVNFEIQDSLLNQGSSSVKNLTDKKLPSQLIDIFGNHFPDELYFYQSIGLEVFKLIESLSFANYVERLPLDMTNDRVYEKMVCCNSSMKIKETVFNLLTGSIHRYYQNKKIIMNTYYSNIPTLHSIDFKFSSNNAIKNLIVRHTTAKSFDLSSVLLNLNNIYLEESTVSNFQPEFISLSTNHELIATSLLRTLATYQFIESHEKIFKLSKTGEVLTEFLKTFNVNFELTLLLFIFLQRLQDSDVELLTKSSDSNDSIQDSEILPALNLISKFSSLYKIENFKSNPYNGPVSRSLLHFNSTVNVIRSEIKDLITVNILVLLFGNKNDIDKFSRDHDEWCSLAVEIPFKNSMPNTVAGLIVEKSFETLFDKVSSKDGESIKPKLAENLAIFETVVENPTRECINSLKFVYSVCDLVEMLNKNGLAKQQLSSKFSGVRSVLDTIFSKLQ